MSWPGPDGQPQEVGGFYTTRWVMASSCEEAIAGATQMVRDEIDKYRPAERRAPIEIEVERCAGLEGYLTTRGRGFAFWMMNEEPDDEMKNPCE